MKKKMKRVNIACLNMVFAVSVMVMASQVHAACYEARNGQLMSGNIKSYLPHLLRTLSTKVDDGALYTVQKKEGFYFKICNESSQIRYFLDHWVTPMYPGGGDWVPSLTTDNEQQLNVVARQGVFKIERKGDQWRVWEYQDKTAQAAAGEKNPPADRNSVATSEKHPWVIILGPGVKKQVALGVDQKVIFELSLPEPGTCRFAMTSDSAEEVTLSMGMMNAKLSKNQPLILQVERDAKNPKPTLNFKNVGGKRTPPLIVELSELTPTGK